MKEGPDISRIGAMLGDPTRASMLVALLGGKALTAGELAHEAGVAPATASGHLKQLIDTGLVAVAAQGRHRYFRLGGQDVARTMETLLGLAASRGHLRTRPGPRDPAMRQARVCYDHLAGAAGVRIFDSLLRQGHLVLEDTLTLGPSGRDWAIGFGLDLMALESRRRPLCRTCLDWSERRTHLSGALGAAILKRMFTDGWAQRIKDSRAVAFTTSGQRVLKLAFPL